MFTKLETLHTKIKRGNVVFNSPTDYAIIHKDSNEPVLEVPIQKGPVKEQGLNGIFIEDLILICINQLENFQNSDFKCIENEATLGHLRNALYSTRARQYDRALRGVQGKSKE